MSIEEFVNDYLQEHRHDVLLSPYNGLIDFANAFKEQMMEGAVVARVSIDELSCGLYNLCVEAGITSETDTTIIILPKED